MSAYKRDFDETKYMIFLIKNHELLKKCNEIWDKFSNTIQKGFDSELVYDEKNLRTKIESYAEKICTNFRQYQNIKRRFSLHLL